MSRWWIFLAARNSDWQSSKKAGKKALYPQLFIYFQPGQCQFRLSAYEVSDLKKGALRFRHFSDMKRGTHGGMRRMLKVRCFGETIFLRQFSWTLLGLSWCSSAAFLVQCHSKEEYQNGCQRCCCHKFGSLHTCRGRNLGALRKPQGIRIAGKKTNKLRRDQGTIDQRMQQTRCTSDVVRYMEKMQAGRAHHRHWLCFLGFIVFWEATWMRTELN